MRWHRLILLLPFVWQLALAPFANGIAWMPLGLPFQMVWQMAGVLVASASIATVFLIDSRIAGDSDEAGR
jgi:hypothetical protein